MFQRIKGAIDSRIAEEQARQKLAQEAHSLSRPNSSTRRSNIRADSRTARLKRENSFPAKSPDPAEFDVEFVVGDDDSSTRTNTPVQMQETSGDVKASGDKEGAGERGRESARPSDAIPGETTQTELPTEVRVKLRRLDKLEGRYQELLKAYRIAHARVLSIEPFEASLRENTPLTSISDPKALTEYLNQISLKGDMVLDELKRVTPERDEYRRKLLEAEKSARDAQEEVARLKARSVSSDEKGSVQDEEMNGGRTLPTVDTSFVPAESNSFANPQKSPTFSTAARASIPGLSLFSPKTKAVTSPPLVEASEEFFSFDNEIPRLELELNKRQEEVDTLKAEVKTLKGDLSVARESTESMAQSLELATRELTGLKEAKDRYEADLEGQRKTLEEQISGLKDKLSVAETDLEKSSVVMEQLQTQLDEKNKELTQTSQKKDDESSKVAAAEEQKTSGEKRLSLLQDIVTNLKSQLKDAENTISVLKAEISSKDAEAKDIQKIVAFVDGGLKGNQTWQVAKQRISDGQTANFDDLRNSFIVSDEQPNIPYQQVPPATKGAKKKNKKKKKKGGKGGAEESSEIAQTPAIEVPISDNTAAVAELENKIVKLTSQLSEKEAAINRLDSKLKGEDDLREEIDSLRDDLRDIGQSFMEAKDKVNELQTEKQALEKTIQDLEKELVDLRTNSSSSSAEAEGAHKDLAAEFEELKIKATALQTDLTTTQQLAASRFKDLTDLRDTFQKLQPELRTLPSKEELKNKTNDLKRLERRHEDVRSEMKNLRGKIGEQEAEIKALNQKVTQETKTRVKAEQALDVAQSDLRYSESKKQEAIETNEKTTRLLSKTQEELRSSRTRLREVEEQVTQLNRDIENLRDEIQLKTAQYASAQSLMNSMRDQTSEMAMQVKEARERCESLEEELADAHRLLSERTREGETMRRLLSDVEMRADAKVRDFKERLEAAIEERDRAEDEANLSGRKRAREIEELKSKARDMERELRRAEQDKRELEAETERSKRELGNVQTAMTELRDALGESENQARELEKEKIELRRSVEETNQRLEKLRKANKALTDEVKAFQASKRLGFDSNNSSGRSPRSSLDSGVQQHRRGGGSVVSPYSRVRSVTPTGPGAGSIDYVYLKNVLLQFLEQKDKNYQKQLIPVLGMLLHFDTNDEQKWMSAISSK
ncbi:hypothetical protein PAAG_11315 [Paracoccidioides lutzii Pb01]|uniref:GRIP domain-containing protein n=1 Tax=Paracoccidioides lutzii (strain ATCC MYA-826 / Pb01) TaxID=502779 RepID=A0A0A2VM29_PARBA|nr:hypothetical protein PAAG_11315 [Paracoccidioides lutzii Pb01]KGQ01924.1 hypothetical protein PAAG_11315 [Paracoccidioides lutzii Pb01]